MCQAHLSPLPLAYLGMWAPGWNTFPRDLPDCPVRGLVPQQRWRYPLACGPWLSTLFEGSVLGAISQVRKWPQRLKDLLIPR